MPPLLRILRLNWLRWRAARRTLPHLADAASRRAFLRHVRRHSSWTRLAVPTDPSTLVALRITDLNGETVWCRSGLADLGVVYDTFAGRYHLPPGEARPVRTILDLGANIGLTAAHLATLFPEARILAVELDRDNCELARRNTACFGARVEVLHGAVWSESGEVRYGGLRESGYAIGETGGRERRAPAFTVEQLIERLGAEEVDYVKMDIEGAEREVLAAGAAWLGRVRTIKVEVHPDKASFLYRVGDCIEELRRRGFACRPEARHHACVTAVRR